MNNDIKYRHELKYHCSVGQINILKSRLENLIELDAHAKKTEGYNIRSVYFDNIRNQCYYENENGTDPREKYRIRIYNCNSERISLECKRKERGKTHKTSCLITKEEYKIITTHGDFEDISSIHPLLRKLSILVKSQLYRPVVIVEYERIPFVCDLGNVRITLDTNIRSSSDIESFFETHIAARPILPSGQHLLEVKYDEFIPDYIKDALQIDNLQCTAFSKYYLSRKFSLRGIL